MVIAVSASREGCRGGNPPPANAVIAVSGPRGYLSRRHGPQPRGKYGLLFYWLAMPFHNRNYQAFNHFLGGRHIEGRQPAANGRVAKAGIWQ
jgi:hypothetical protein